MAKEFKISTLRLKELEQELFYLKTTREKEVAEQIKEARSFGDLSENSEYDEAKNEQAKLYGRIAEVENILAHAVIIDENEDAEGKIGLGCTIKVLDMEITRNADGDKITSCAIFTLRLNKKCKADWLLGQLHAIKGIVLVEEL